LLIPTVAGVDSTNFTDKPGSGHSIPVGGVLGITIVLLNEEIHSLLFLSATQTLNVYASAGTASQRNSCLYLFVVSRKYSDFLIQWQ